MACRYSLNKRRVNSGSPGRIMSPGTAWISVTTPTAGDVTPRSETPGRSAISPGIRMDRQYSCGLARLETSPRFFLACELISKTVCFSPVWSVVVAAVSANLGSLKLNNRSRKIHNAAVTPITMTGPVSVFSNGSVRFISISSFHVSGRRPGMPTKACASFPTSGMKRSLQARKELTKHGQG